jgi:hypothetical protein
MLTNLWSLSPTDPSNRPTPFWLSFVSHVQRILMPSTPHPVPNKKTLSSCNSRCCSHNSCHNSSHSSDSQPSHSKPPRSTFHPAAAAASAVEATEVAGASPATATVPETTTTPTAAPASIAQHAHAAPCTSLRPGRAVRTSKPFQLAQLLTTAHDHQPRAATVPSNTETTPSAAGVGARGKGGWGRGGRGPKDCGGGRWQNGVNSGGVGSAAMCCCCCGCCITAASVALVVAAVSPEAVSCAADAAAVAAVALSAPAASAEAAQVAAAALAAATVAVAHLPGGAGGSARGWKGEVEGKAQASKTARAGTLQQPMLICRHTHASKITLFQSHTHTPGVPSHTSSTGHMHTHMFIQ